MKLGLVLEGGASRTYFSVGAMDALLDKQIFADYVIGTSAGIANGISYVSGQKGRSLDIGLSYLSDKRYMGLRHLLRSGNRSFYNISFVFDEIPNKHKKFDYEAFSSFKGEVYAVVTNLNTGKAEYLPVTANDKSWKVVVASCALPIMFQPVEINGNLYMDGGIVDSIPVTKAIEDGCDKIITIITREREYLKNKETEIGLASFKYRKFPNFADAIKRRPEAYNESHKRLLELEKKGSVYVIAPQNTVNWKRTDKSAEKIMEMYKEGYNTVISEIEKIRSYLGHI